MISESRLFRPENVQSDQHLQTLPKHRWKLAFCSMTFLVFAGILLSILLFILTHRDINLNSFNQALISLQFESNSQSFLRSPDHSFDPCQDFYRFACGIWNQNNSWKTNELPLDHLLVAEKNIRDNVAEMLLEPVNPNDIPGYKYAQHFFKTCIHSDTDYADVNLVWNIYGPVEGLSQVYIDRLRLAPMLSEKLEKCLDLTQNFYKLPIGHKMLTRKYKNNDIKLQEVFAEAKQIAENVLESNKQLIQKSFRKKPEIKQALFTRLSELIICMGFPEWILNESRVQQECNQLPVLPNSTLMELVPEIEQWTVREYSKTKNGMGTCDSWGLFPGGIGAFFMLHAEHYFVYVKMGLLQPPYFDLNRNKAVNYGVLGFLLGHELTHSIDEVLLEKYKDDAAIYNVWCLEHQYLKYLSKKNKVQYKTRQTEKENVADNAGLQVAYYAYNLAMMKGQVDSSRKPFGHLGKYTDEQLFFLTYAQFFCETYETDGVSKQTLYDDHNPSEFRVLGVLQNSKEFATAWNCPVGSGMNPYQMHRNFPRKCVLYS